jgi:hypothetical protein
VAFVALCGLGGIVAPKTVNWGQVGPEGFPQDTPSRWVRGLISNCRLIDGLLVGCVGLDCDAHHRT